MTTATATNVLRPQIDTEPSAFARAYPARRPVSVQPARNAENPFEAANGTLHFANERKTVKSTASARSTSSTRASSAGTAQKRTTSSGGSGQPPKKRKRRSKKKTRRLILFASAFLLFAVLVLVGAVLLVNYYACGGRERCAGELLSAADTPAPGTTAAPTLDETVIEKNVTVDGISLQNLTVAEARQKLNDKAAQNKNAVSITVVYEEYSATLRAEDIGLDYTESVNDALLLAAQGDTAQTLHLTPAIDSQALRNALNGLNEQIPSHAVNAQAEVKYKSNKIDSSVYYQPYWDFTEGVNGAKINADALEQQIYDAVNAGSFTASLTPTVAVSEPEVTVDTLKAQYHLLSSYATNYRFKGTSSMDAAAVENAMARDANISKAVAMMQVIELKPGKTWSFNKTTGDRSEKKGWAPANAVYQGSGYRKEPGGGVCQISTTMFNALLRAGITSIGRTGHSIPSDYVTSDFEKGLGFDATVDYGHIDFSFKNDTGSTIYVFIYITKNKDSGRRKNINVEIYGQEQPGVEYRVYNEILEKTPSNDESKYEYETDKTMLASAKPVLLRNPHDGYKVKTYVDKYVNGSLSKTVYTEETVYKVIYPKYKIGSAVITPAPTNTPKPPTPEPEEPDTGDD